MIPIEMFRGTMGISTQIFTKFFTPRGGGDTDKRKLRIAAAADPREVHKNFLAKVRILVTIIF